MRKLYIALVTLSMIWGTSFLFIKLLVNDLSTWEIVFWRCFFGTIVLWGIFIYKKRSQTIHFKNLPWGSLMLIGFLNNALPWGLIALSETVISSGLASIFNATTPIWTSVIGIIFFSRKLRGMQWFGIVVGFIGIIILSDVGNAALFEGSFVGVVTMLVAAICYGFSSQFTKKKLSYLPSLTLATITLSFATLFSFILALFESGIRVNKIFEASTFFAFIGLGTFGSGFAILIFYYLIQKGSAEFASTVTYLVPVTALLWGVLFLNEVISIQMVLGLFCVLTGVYLSTYQKKRKKEVHYEKAYRVL